MYNVFLHLLTPHRTNNYRARLLQPMGLAVLMAVLLLAQSGLQLLRLAPALPQGLILGYASNITATQVVELTNVKRSEEGLSSLRYSSVLSEAAAAKAAHMFANDYWAHIAPDGTTPWTFIKGSGYRYAVAGENLARDFDDTHAMVGAWMGSPTHKENIIHQRYTEIGVAVVDGVLQGIETTLVVQMFGAPVEALAAVPTAQIPPAGAQSEAPGPLETEAAAIGAEAEAVQTSKPEESPILVRDHKPIVDVLAYDGARGVTLSSNRVSGMAERAMSPLTVSKAISSAMVMLMIVLLVYDAVYIHRKQVPRFVGKNWAHVTFFSIVLILILGVVPGKVL